MFKNVNVIWGIAIPFDKNEKQLYMIYYGFFINGIFIGVSRLVSKNDLTFKPKSLKPVLI